MSTLMTPQQRHETAQPRHGRLRPILAGVGAFLLVAGLFLRFYAAPRLVAAPTNLYQTDVLVAHNASYFNQGTLTSQFGATLNYTVTLRGDPAASNNQTAVWDEFSSLADPTYKYIVQSTYQRAAFDRRTGALLSCCGAALNDNTRLRPTGIGIFWPLGTKKTTYQVFDTNTGRSWPASYAGQQLDEGVLTYRFVQHIPATLVQQLPGVPASLLGLSGTSGNIVASRYYGADVTYWVDPRTGVLIDQQEKGLSVLRGPTGQGRLTVADFNLRMTDASRRALAAQANKNAASIAMVRLTAPLGGVVLGLILILLAAVPFGRSRRLRGQHGRDTGRNTGPRGRRPFRWSRPADALDDGAPEVSTLDAADQHAAPEAVTPEAEVADPAPRETPPRETPPREASPREASPREASPREAGPPEGSRQEAGPREASPQEAPAGPPEG